MPVIFVIVPDWKTRIAVRAELRELSIDALGMESADDVGRAIITGGLPNLVVLEATAELLGDIRIQNLIQCVPAVLIASRTVRVSIPDVAAVLYRPVRVAKIVACVRELLNRDDAA